MEKATVSRLENNLSAYLRKVRAGHSVVIYGRELLVWWGTPVEIVSALARREGFAVIAV